MSTYCFIQISIDNSKEYPVDENESQLFDKAGRLVNDVERAVLQVVKDKYPEFEVGRVEMA